MATLPIYNELSKQEEPKPVSSDDTSIPVIEIDMNEPGLTLFKIIKRTNEVILNTPDDRQIRIYFVSSETLSYTFWVNYFEYVATLPNPPRLVIIYRGFLHFENLQLFLLDIPVLVNSNCNLIYRKERLHDILNNISKNVEIRQNFLKRFFEYYKNLDYFTSDDLTELQVLGLEFQTF